MSGEIHHVWSPESLLWVFRGLNVLRAVTLTLKKDNAEAVDRILGPAGIQPKDPGSVMLTGSRIRETSSGLRSLRLRCLRLSCLQRGTSASGKQKART